MSDETWPWYALPNKGNTGQGPNQSVLSIAIACGLLELLLKHGWIKVNLWIKELSPLNIVHVLSFCSSGAAPGVFEQWRGSSTHLSNVMMSLWPLYCCASRRARSLASELKFKGARVTLSYSVTTKYTGEAMDITCTSQLHIFLSTTRAKYFFNFTPWNISSLLPSQTLLTSLSTEGSWTLTN